MSRALLGLIKGLIVGGGVGYGLLHLMKGSPMWTGGAWAYLACAVVGAVVGVVCGRPPWKSETIWTPVVKLVVGGLIGLGLCALGRLQSTGLGLPLPSALGAVAVTTKDGPFLAVVVGALYGLFVEIDDGGKSDKDGQKKLANAAAKSLKGK